VTGAAIGQILPLAVGVALSPVPIIAVALMLMSQRARLNGPVQRGHYGRYLPDHRGQADRRRHRRLQQLTISAGTPHS
jgi:hypothetical protein